METTALINTPDGIILDAAYVEVKRSLGTAILIHGITANRDEGGMYTKLAGRLAESGFNSLRFSFRGHGKSTGTQESVTIAGELIDILAVHRHLCNHNNPPSLIIASSFGAVAALESYRFLTPAIGALVLWNPVLDLKDTFLHPQLPWGIKNFGTKALPELKRNGFLYVDDDFRLGISLWNEFELYAPLKRLDTVSVPSLLVHGVQDQYVSYDIAKTAATKLQSSTFVSVESDHGFSPSATEDYVIEETIQWISSHAK